MSDAEPRKQQSDHFNTTHWSLVLVAGTDSSRSAAALAKLCGAYWYPLYAFIRRRGYARADAEDLTQAFFEKLLDKKYLESADGTPVISMEHIAGGTLQDRVRQSGPVPADAAVDAILQIIDGLEAAANTGVLHRDVKPSNCLVDSDGTVKIGDFGLSISKTVRSDSYLTSAIAGLVILQP